MFRRQPVQHAVAVVFVFLLAALTVRHQFMPSAPSSAARQPTATPGDSFDTAYRQGYGTGQWVGQHLPLFLLITVLLVTLAVMALRRRAASDRVTR